MDNKDGFCYCIGMFVGYARVSTQDQSLDLQLAALKQGQCDHIYSDRISGSVAERKGMPDPKVKTTE